MKIKPTRPISTYSLLIIGANRKQRNQIDENSD